MEGTGTSWYLLVLVFEARRHSALVRLDPSNFLDHKDEVLFIAKEPLGFDTGTSE
jgi:hypothetical protein